MLREHIEFVVNTNNTVYSFFNKNILDIGCGNGETVQLIASYYQPRMVIGIDPFLHEQKNGDNWSILNGDAENLPFDDNMFDVIISMAAFEHINDIKKALFEVKRVLKPFGIFYCIFGHIWTSVNGYHDDGTARQIMMVPPWGHLYMNEQEMADHFLKNGVDDAEANLLLDWIYHNKSLNRHSRTSLANWIFNAGMWVREYRESIGFSRKQFIRDGDMLFTNSRPPSEMTQSIREKISNTDYRIEDLGCCGISFLLEKYSDLY